MTSVWIGLDIGTTGLKAAAFDRRGDLVALRVQPTPLQRGGAEFDAGELWSAAVAAIGSMMDELTDRGLVPGGIACASIGETGVALDDRGDPLYPCSTWLDPRMDRQTRWWRQQVGEEVTAQITALPVRPKFGAIKLLWLRDHHPDIFARIRHWLQVADFVAFRLCGQMATDHSLASRTLLFDLDRRRWSASLLTAAGIEPSILPAVVASGTEVGEVSPVAAQQTGLPIGLRVMAGGQDHVCAALALGVTEPGTLLDSIGTAEAFFFPTREPTYQGPVVDAGIPQGAHVVVGRSYAMWGLNPGGGRIDEVRRTSGLEWDEFLLTDRARRESASLAADAHDAIQWIAAAVGTPIIRHIVTGGGARNPLLMAAKQALSTLRIEESKLPQAACLGAAMLAGCPGVGARPTASDRS